MNGSTVTGRLVKRYPRPSSPSEPQFWIVAPSDRRRKNEKVSELELRRVEDEDTTGGGGNKRKGSKSGSSQGSKGSDDNDAKASSSSTGSGSNGIKKRKSGDISDNASGNSGKKVTFQDQKKKKKSPTNGLRVGTRATRNSGHELFNGSEQPLPRKKAAKKVKKNEHVTVVQMLTGTLYLYKGKTRRAEFVRSKY